MQGLISDVPGRTVSAIGVAQALSAKNNLYVLKITSI
jgi:hypothetical protein